MKYRRHEEAREENRELLRRNVLEAANHILSTEGAAALTVRRVAQELDASTKVIYTLFDGKDGLADALYEEGCVQIRTAFEGVPVGTNFVEYATQIGWAYWTFSQEYATHFALMFNGALTNYTPDEQRKETLDAALESVTQALATYIASGDIRGWHDEHEAGLFLWVPLNSIITFHQMGHYDEAEAKRLYQHVLNALIAYLSK